MSIILLTEKRRNRENIPVHYRNHSIITGIVEKRQTAKPNKTVYTLSTDILIRANCDKTTCEFQKQRKHNTMSRETKKRLSRIYSKAIGLISI